MNEQTKRKAHRSPDLKEERRSSPHVANLAVDLAKLNGATRLRGRSGSLIAKREKKPHKAHKARRLATPAYGVSRRAATSSSASDPFATSKFQNWDALSRIIDLSC